MWKLLIIEDERIMTEWISAYIEKLFPGRFDINTGSNGREALEIMKEKGSFDLLITDIMMPVIDGLDLVKYIDNNIENKPYTIVLSNYDDFKFARTAFRYNVDEYLLKSEINDDVLIETIGNFLNHMKAPYVETSNDSERRYSETIRRVIDYIKHNYADVTGLKEISKVACLSPEYFSRLFKAETGVNFSAYLNDYRLEKAQELIVGSEMQIYEIAEKVGFSNISYFSLCFKKKYGASPFQYRSTRNGKS